MYGKYLARHQMVICLGLSADGRKIPMGFIETTTENAEAIKGLQQRRIERGLSFDEGILCIIDGSKGLFKAVRDVSCLFRSKWTANPVESGQLGA
jgi:putative transposase